MEHDQHSALKQAMQEILRRSMRDVRAEWRCQSGRRIDVISRMCNDDIYGWECRVDATISDLDELWGKYYAAVDFLSLVTNPGEHVRMLSQPYPYIGQPRHRNCGIIVAERLSWWIVRPPMRINERRLVAATERLRLPRRVEPR